MTIDLSAPRYAALQPPKFVESELRAYLRAEHRQRRQLPTLREIKARFGGGATRIHRIRRSVEVELGLREPEVRPQRVRRAAGRLERLIESLERLLGDSTIGAAAPARDPGIRELARSPSSDTAADWKALRKSWDYLGDRHDAIHQRLDAVAHQQDRMADHLLRVFDLVTNRQRGWLGAAEQFQQHADDFLDRQESVLARLAQSERRRGDDKALDQRLDSLAQGVAQIIDGQQRLGVTMQDLSRHTGRIHHGLEAAADRLEDASTKLTDAGEAAVSRQAAALKRLETTAGALDQAARDADARAEHAIMADRGALTATLEARLEDLDQKLTLLGDKVVDAAPADVDLTSALRALGEQLGTQIAEASATTGNAIERQRSASDRGGARTRQALGELLEAVTTLGRRRPPRTVHLHEDSLQAIDATMARRFTAAARARNRAESAARRSTKRSAPTTRRRPASVKTRQSR